MSGARLANAVAGMVLGGVLLAVGLVFLLGFVMSDPPEPRDVAPLEFVAIDADGAQCILNRGDVAAGVHHVGVMTSGSGATVELLDGTGNIVFQAGGGPQGFSYIKAAESYEGLRLEEGRHTLVCRYPDGTVGEATLTVTAE